MLIENKNFQIQVPNFAPHDRERKPWWREQRKRLFEGYWVGGKWMPPNLYQYVNFWYIRISEDDTSKNKRKGKPFLRDLEWEKSYILQEAKGFSGFEFDDKETCLRAVSPENIDFTKVYDPEVFEQYGHLKYVPAREYLRKIFGRSNLGRPLYENNASNVIDVEARGGGKSYFAANNIAHNFLTDGVRNYEEYIKARRAKKEYNSETLVGAYDSKWSGDLLDKVKYGLENLEGGSIFNGLYYPSPHSKQFKGSWKENDYIEAKYQVKEGGTWNTYGTGSKIYHRTFRNNPFAGNGTRSNEIYVEEIGFMKNLKESLNNMRDAVYDGNDKFGMVWMLGTGGDMEGGATEGAKDIFYNPGINECLEFDDIYEGKGKIGLFVPAHMTFNKYRDSEGIQNVERAKLAVEMERQKYIKDKDKYNSVLVNRPEKPSEAFRLDIGSKFPILEIEEQIGFLEARKDDLKYRGQTGDFTIDQDGKVKWVHDLKGKLTPADFPIKKGKQAPGSVVIWEHPPSDKEIPYGRYIAATDPYDQDQAPNSVSVGSTLVMKTFDPDSPETSWSIVAEYSGRPRTAKQHHERVRLLLMYYQCQDLYENDRNTLKVHFEHKKSLHLLLDTPTSFTSRVNKKTSLGRSNKGVNMTVGLREDLEIYGSDFLTEERPEGGINLHLIKSIPLLKELKDYNFDGNFDRADAFLLLTLHLNYIKTKISEQKKEEQKERQFELLRSKPLNMVERMIRDIDDIEDRKSFIDKINKGEKVPLIPGMFKQKQNIRTNGI